MTVLTLSEGLALDLGSANTLIYRKGSGIALNEPSLVALETKTNRVLAVGREAKEYLGRTPKGMEVARPVKGGVIGDPTLAAEMIRRFLEQAGAGRRRLFRPKIVMGAPSGAAQPEKRTLMEAALLAGAKAVSLVNSTLASALGLGLDIAGPMPQIILDVGDNLAQGVIISMGAVAFRQSRRAGGNEATLAVIHHLRRKFDLDIGENMAERIKMTLGSALSGENSGPCRGKEAPTGIPKEISLTREDLGELGEALEDGVALELAALVESLLKQAPPDLNAALRRNGLHLTGGGSLLAGLGRCLARETGLNVHSQEAPHLSAALGLGEIMENFQQYKGIFAN